MKTIANPGLFVFFLSPLLCEKKIHTFLVTHLEADDSRPALLHRARMEFAEMDYISEIAYLRVSSVHLPSASGRNCYLLVSHVAAHDEIPPAC